MIVEQTNIESAAMVVCASLGDLAEELKKTSRFSEADYILEIQQEFLNRFGPAWAQSTPR